MQPGGGWRGLSWRRPSNRRIFRFRSKARLIARTERDRSSWTGPPSSLHRFPIPRESVPVSIIVSGCAHAPLPPPPCLVHNEPPSIKFKVREVLPKLRLPSSDRSTISMETTVSEIHDIQRVESSSWRERFFFFSLYTMSSMAGS